MGNMCGAGQGISSALKNQAFNLIVQKAAGSTGDSNLSFLQSTLKSVFPAATVSAANVNTPDSNFFNVLLGNQLLHSNATNGNIQNNASGFLSNLKNALTSQLGLGVQQGQQVANAQQGFAQNVNTAQQGYGQTVTQVQQTYGTGANGLQQGYGQVTNQVQQTYGTAANGLQQGYNQAYLNTANAYNQAATGAQTAYGQGANGFGQAYAQTTTVTQHAA